MALSHLTFPDGNLLTKSKTPWLLGVYRSPSQAFTEEGRVGVEVGGREDGCLLAGASSLRLPRTTRPGMVARRGRGPLTSTGREENTREPV